MSDNLFPSCMLTPESGLNFIGSWMLVDATDDAWCAAGGSMRGLRPVFGTCDALNVAEG